MRPVNEPIEQALSDFFCFDDGCVLPAIGRRGETRGPLEEPPEEGRILVADDVPNVIDRALPAFEPCARGFDPEGEAW